jgi:hypothetical protein
MAAPEFKGYTSPDSRLFNITLDRYLTADFHYQSVDSVNKICETEKIVETLWTRKSHRKLRLSNAESTAVYLWYTGAKKYLRDEYPYIFTQSSGDMISPRETVLGLLSVFNDGKPQNNEQILKTSVHEVFFELNRMIKYKKSHGK